MYSTLKVIDPDASLLHWIVDGQPVEREKRERCLLVFEDTGRLLWPALNRTQVSQFGTNLSMSEPIDLDGHAYSITFNLDAEPTNARNLEIQLRHRDRGFGRGVDVAAFFSLDGLKLAGIAPSRADDPEAATLCLRIKDRWPTYEPILRARLLDPFRADLPTRSSIGGDSGSACTCWRSSPCSS